MERNNIIKEFVKKLRNQGNSCSSYVYHFTHITNAVKIIKDKKIYSRNKVIEKNPNFADGAGSVVNISEMGHRFARFYFRPKTPTQFYNESLGQDCSMNYFNKAKDHNLPKCPIPIFFRFDIEEILNNQLEKCSVSNGNLQKGNVEIVSIEEALQPDYDVNGLYGKDKDLTQKEFLVCNEFDFSQLNNYEIFVRTKADWNQLIYLIKKENQPEMVEKIGIATPSDAIYDNGNQHITYSIENNIVKISTNYLGDGNNAGEFEIEFENDSFEIHCSDSNILSRSENKIRFFPNIEIKLTSKTCFSVLFNDLVTNDKGEKYHTNPWKIIEYCND